MGGDENVSAIVCQDSTSNQEIAQKVDDSRVTKKWLTRNLPPIDFN